MNRIGTFAIFAVCCAAQAFGAESSGVSARLSYSLTYENTFAASGPATAKQARLLPGGRLSAVAPIEGKVSLRAASDGKVPYFGAYQTDPEALRLEPGAEYILRFRYRVEKPGKKDFEALFYSPETGKRGQWLPSANFGGGPGAEGTKELRVRLLEYRDYAILFNVPAGGEYQIDAISVRDAAGREIFADGFETRATVTGPGLVCEGARPEPGLLRLRRGDSVTTNPDAVPLEPHTVYRVSFDYAIVGTPAGDICLKAGLMPAKDDPRWVEFGFILRNAPTIGRYSCGFRTGNLKTGKIRLEADGAEVEIRGLRVERGTPVPTAASPETFAWLKDAPFPRLGNYTCTAPRLIARDDSFEGRPMTRSTEELERRMALFDLTVGMYQYPDFDAEFTERLRALNPHAVFAPYLLGQEADSTMREQFAVAAADPDLVPDKRYVTGLADDWFVRNSVGQTVDDLDYPGLRKMDTSPDCPRVGGKNFVEYQTDFVTRWIFAPGLYDGVFFDNLFASMNCHIPNAMEAGRLDYDLNRNGLRDETPALLNRVSLEGSVALLRGVAKVGSNRAFVIGNNGPSPETRLAPFLNGYMFEGPANRWDARHSDGAPRSEPGWRGFLRVYQEMDRLCLEPRLNVFEAMGELRNLAVPTKGRSEITARDVERQRFNIGTALLGNAFYEYDLEDRRSTQQWFDEYAVDAQGRAVESAEGKGYLGRALGPAVELARPAKPLWSEGFEGSWIKGDSIGATAVDGPNAISGRKSLAVGGNIPGSAAESAYRSPVRAVTLKAGKTCLFRFYWKAIDDLDFSPALIVAGPAGYGTWTEIPARFAGEAGSFEAPFTPPADGVYRFIITVRGGGTLLLDDLELFEGGVGPWRRDFERGVVFVNPYESPANLDAKELAGSLGRTGLRRIKGNQAPAINTGAPQTSSLRLGPFDAIILLADPAGRKES